MFKNVPMSVLGERGLESDESKPKAAKQKMVKNFKAKQQLANSIVECICHLSLRYVSCSLLQRFFWLPVEGNSRIRLKKIVSDRFISGFFPLFDSF